MIRFHLTSGARLSLRAAAPAVGAVVLAVGLSPNPGASFEALAVQLTTTTVPGSPAPWVAAALCVLLAFAACRRLAPAVRGWLLHLPVSGPEHFRAFTVAVLAAQLPVLAAWLGLWLYGAASGVAVAGSRLALIPMTGLCAALAAAIWSRVNLSRRKGATGYAGPPAPTRLVPLWIVWRAVGPRLLQTCLTAALPLGALNLFLRNNVLDVGLAEGASRFATTLAASAVIIDLVIHLAVRRPSWPWFRSLPRSSARRVLDDALLLWAHAAPFVITAWIILLPGPASVVAGIAASCLIAVRGAAALRRDRSSRMGVSGPLLLECLILCAWTGVSSLAGLVWLLLIPFAFRSAVTMERNARIYRWEERHHRNVGDPMSWRTR